MSKFSLLLLSVAALSGVARAAESVAVHTAVAPVTTDVLGAPAPESLKAEVKVGTGIENREPVGVSATFGPNAGLLVGWCRVTGALHPQDVTQVWSRNGEEVARVKLRIQSASFRTHSGKNVTGLPGNWSLEVFDASGKKIGSTDFDVTDK